MARETIPMSCGGEDEKVGSKLVEGISLFICRSSCRVHDSINNSSNELYNKKSLSIHVSFCKDWRKF